MHYFGGNYAKTKQKFVKIFFKIPWATPCSLASLVEIPIVYTRKCLATPEPKNEPKMLPELDTASSINFLNCKLEYKVE